MATEIIHNPMTAALPYLALAVGLTAITFIAIVLFLDNQPIDEPLEIPERH